MHSGETGTNEQSTPNRAFVCLSAIAGMLCFDFLTTEHRILS